MTTKDSEERVFVYVCVNSTITYEGTREMKRSEFDQLSGALDSRVADLRGANFDIAEDEEA